MWVDVWWFTKSIPLKIFNPFRLMKHLSYKLTTVLNVFPSLFQTHLSNRNQKEKSGKPQTEMVKCHPPEECQSEMEMGMANFGAIIVECQLLMLILIML